MSRLYAVPAHERHVRLVLADMRARDRRELAECFGQSPQEVMRIGLRDSVRTVTLLFGLKPMCMAGIVPLSVMSGRYQLWIIPTAQIDAHPFAFARASKRYLPWLIAGCDIASNYIDCNDMAAMKWANWLGCRFHAPMLPDGCEPRFWQFFLEGRTWRQASA